MDTQTVATTTNQQPTTTNNNNENIQFKFFCQSHFYSFTLLNIIIILYDFLMNDDLKREKMGGWLGKEWYVCKDGGSENGRREGWWFSEYFGRSLLNGNCFYCYCK